MAKLIASRVSWGAANAWMDAHGGYGFAAEYHIERKSRETPPHGGSGEQQHAARLIGQQVLGMPRFL